MKITLITCCYNSANTIKATLDSVGMQTHSNLEYIVIDGGSTDNTLEVLAGYSNVITVLVSEPDRGIYDALNKGLALATGEVVGFLHSDDYFASSDALERIAASFSDSRVDAVYADLDYVDREDTDRILRKWRSKEFDPDLFKHGWMPAHPTFYLRKKYYDQFGGYDLDFRQSADYELMLRMLLKHELHAVYIPVVLIKMRVGGASNASFTNRWKANQEDARAWAKNGIKPGWLTRWLKPLGKIGQFTGS
jgi:glycosyltransferase involved in cell wall biosynthesis